ncbi:MAG: hypothetical protein IBX44_09770 [Sulfurospirillum sp.]|nr:hypothetical protein [Sulfurospirillum sp.]
MFYFRLVLLLVGIVILIVVGRMIFLPDSWGQYGYYRGAYIHEEAAKNLVYGTNDSCKECHKEIYDLKLQGHHQRLSCEICHAPVGEHAQNGEKIADMPRKLGEPQVDLCLKCHIKVEGKPEKFPVIEYPKHLSDQNVKVTHTCDQCHTVHAPLENIERGRTKGVTLKMEVSGGN